MDADDLRNDLEFYRETRPYRKPLPPHRHGHDAIVFGIKPRPSALPDGAVLRLYIQMPYEWDEVKNRLNQKKHGVSFELAALALEDENCLVR